MIRFIAMSIVLASVASFAFAGAPTTPEIDASSAVAAVGLLSGGLLVLRARRKKYAKPLTILGSPTTANQGRLFTA